MKKEQKAQLNNLNITPRKVRLIANTIKGLPVDRAQAQLMLRPQRPAGKLLKLLNSAIANAKNNAGMNADLLVVSKIWVDPATSFKRSLPRSMGRATPILKRNSHVTIILTESEKPVSKRFTIAEKAKKEVKHQHDKKAGDVQPKPKQKDEDKERESKENAPQKGQQRGALKRFFNRKSI
jgi:large subunit ribosomal protein L22